MRGCVVVLFSLISPFEPSISAIPTSATVEVIFELPTDGYPTETIWSLTDNSHKVALVYSGPGNREIYDANYRFVWTLNRCTFYTFTICDFLEDSLANPWYVVVKTQSRKVMETLGRIDVNFGLESSIYFYICNVDFTSSPSSSLILSIN